MERSSWQHEKSLQRTQTAFLDGFVNSVLFPGLLLYIVRELLANALDGIVRWCRQRSVSTQGNVSVFVATIPQHPNSVILTVLDCG